MDFVRALTFPFDDDEWLKKLGLTFLITLIPIAGVIAVYGWMLEIIRRVKMNDPQPLPEWADFGEYLRKGFMLFLAILIYSLPVALLSFLAYVPMMASNENNVGLMSVLSIICSCVLIILGLAVSILMLVGIVRYADSDNFSDFFAFSDNFRMLKDNIGDFGMALLYLIGFSVLVGLVSGITFGLGTIVAVPLTATFTGHLYGQLARKFSTASAPTV